MDQFEFDKLNEDNQLELLKYMPIKERIRFERINTIWGHLLDRLWLSQKHLVFGDGFFSRYHADLERCHPVHFIDLFVTTYLPEHLPAHFVLKIVSKCNNLIALEVSSNAFQQIIAATQFANVLNDKCKELEHLNIPFIDLVFFELFVPSAKFVCLRPLECMVLKLLYDKSRPAELLSLKTLRYEDREGDPRTLCFINKATVQHLSVDYFDVKFKELINLKSMNNKSDRPDQTASLNICQLEHLSTSRISASDLRRLFENNRNLLSLRILHAADELSDIQIIFTFGSNFKQLHLEFDSVSLVGDYKFWQNMAKLTKLRTLTISAQEREPGDDVSDSDGREKNWMDTKWVNPNLNVNGLILVLKTCIKLKELRFVCSSNAEQISTEEKDQIRTVVAGKSFRQSFVVTFEDNKVYHYMVVELGQGVVSLI